MKSTFNAFFLLVFLLSIKSEAVAQPLFSLAPDYYYIKPTIDTLLDFDQFWANGLFEVESQDTLFVKWNITGKENCPDGWRYTVYDTHLCFMSTWLTSNIDPVNNVEVPMPLGGGYDVKIFNVAVSPKGIPGCCQLQIEFSLVEEPDSIIEVATYDFEILDPSCFSSIIEIEEDEQVIIAPNPANSSFHLTTQSAVASVSLFDAMGKIVTDYSLIDNSKIMVSDLPNGTYFLMVRLQDGQLTWEKLVVQH